MNNNKTTTQSILELYNLLIKKSNFTDRLIDDEHLAIEIQYIDLWESQTDLDLAQTLLAQPLSKRMYERSKDMVEFSIDSNEPDVDGTVTKRKAQEWLDSLEQYRTKRDLYNQKKTPGGHSKGF